MNYLQTKTKFSMTFGDLNQLADKLIRFARRDMMELMPFGITAAWIDDLEAKNAAAKDFPSDEESVGDQKFATDAKDAAREKLHHLLTMVMVHVKACFGLDSTAYERFGTKAIGESTDSDFARKAGKVRRNLILHMPALTQVGLTPMLFADFTAAVDAFDNAIDDKEDAVSKRDRETQERAMISNEVYAQIIILTDYAKAYFYSRDEARYNDYVIYDTPAAPKNKGAKKDPPQDAPIDPPKDAIVEAPQEPNPDVK